MNWDCLLMSDPKHSIELFLKKKKSSTQFEILASFLDWINPLAIRKATRKSRGCFKLEKNERLKFNSYFQFLEKNLSCKKIYIPKFKYMK